TLAPVARSTSSKGPTNLSSRSRTRNRTARQWSSNVETRLRACWEEIARERAGSLGSQEVRPRRSRSSWRRAQAVTAQQVAHAGGRDGHTELAALADDAEIAPARVLPGQAE